MANNILYISDGDYGSPAGYILPLVQGQYGQSIPLEIRDLAGNVASLTGYSTITGHKRKGGSVTAIVGTLTLSGTPTVAPQITWVVDEDDTGDYGTFALFLEITNGTVTYTTHPVNLQIVRDPAVNATAAAGLVGVTTAQKALLAALDGALPAVNGDIFKYSSGAWETSPPDVDDLTTTTGTSSQMLRVAAAGGLEYRTVAQVLADLQDSGALAITDIGVLVASIGANTFTGAQNLADNLLTRPVIKDYGETVNAIGSTGGGTQDIDLTLGNVVSATVDTSTNTFTFSNPSATGTACSFTLILTNGGSQTVNWPASVTWAGGTAPTLTAAGVDILTFTTVDGGTTWYGFAAGLDMS